MSNPIYMEITYGTNREDYNLVNILRDTGGNLTVISKNVQPIEESSLEKFQLNLSSSNSVIQPSLLNCNTGQSDVEMKCE